MNYYPFHIGDYASATRHLSWEEDLAYRRLLDVYYTTEKPLPTDLRQVCRLVLATNDAQREAVEVVLAEFFEPTNEGWVSARADAEIESMREKQQKQRDKANKRWAKPQQEHGNAPAMPRHEESDATASKTDADAMPPTPTPTPTPTPINKNTGASAKRGKPAVDRPEGVSETIWSDFLTVRKAKRAPLTATALDGIEREAAKAGISLNDALSMCCARGWQGFKAEWVQGQMVASAQGAETNFQRAMREEVEQWAPSVAKKAPIALRPVGQILDAELVTPAPKALGVA